MQPPGELRNNLLEICMRSDHWDRLALLARICKSTPDLLASWILAQGIANLTPDDLTKPLSDDDDDELQFDL